jgi:phosphate transport system protein
MSDKQRSSQFDAALNLLSTRLLEMGGLVESQISAVLTLLSRFFRSKPTTISPA